ncbi:DUF2911 domain-containing protein [Flavivirga sp. 57AJ16]|uniref:DUF2911 domain-containing protein n=1 Tax=Flavivirga sp. 57AJ16 TaxID=3025307 RepID=UPI002367396B|nr:DUF2911 domain-containing protein [Flavivirga sp. 57AJ16]MDD7887679.1 DUF2911 domain-containing protein [Flavivirga sp. 57AJ16]
METNHLARLFVCVLLALSFNTFAQVNMPRASQQATMSQRVGISDISITYSRPRVNGREIWGKLVPYGMNNLGFGTATAAPWRAGANENTTITFTHDATLEGKPIKAGTYGFHIELKDADNATIILSHDTHAWGSYFYDASNDALRADVKTKSVPHKELLTYEVNNVQPTFAIVSLVWEKKEIPFKVAFDVTDIVLNEFRDKSIGNLGFNRQNWENMARFSLNNGGDLNEALGWIDGAIAGNFYSQKTFNNLALKGQILNKLGKKEAYAALMDEASSMANKNQLNTLGYQMLTAKDYDRALKYFKLNVANNPKDANSYDSLGECYKTMGDKKNAIKYLKKSLSLNPPANVKANSEKLLKELDAL